MAAERAARRRRADGEESRRRILDAAVEVAGERGYDGTSIALVSAKCGLPASSIYWHFENKDDLIAAVIERSFGIWLAAVTPPPPDVGSPRERLVSLAVEVAKALQEAPDFLRLGLMLSLEHRPEEPSARTMFLQVRSVAHRWIADMIRELAPGTETDAVELLSSYAMAGADGLFLAKEVGGDSVDLVRMFELHAYSLIDAAARLTGRELS